jgi:hypothetical protein
MRRVTAPSGVLLVYDVRYPNPGNRHTRPIGREELRHLFPDLNLRFAPITLIPQLARRLGAATPALYGTLSRRALLRSHYLTVGRPCAEPARVSRSDLERARPS